MQQDKSSFTMSTKNRLLLIIFNLLLIVSCQSDQQSAASVSANDYIPNIYSRYLTMEKEFKIEVTFTSKKDNKLKNQEVPGDLFFRDKKLMAAETRYGGTRYIAQIPQTHYSESKVIEWKQGNRVLGTYQSTMPAIEYYDIPEKKIGIKKGFRLVWDGPPLTKEEFLTIVINPERGEQLRMNRLGPTDESYCSVVPQQLVKLEPGTTKVIPIKNKRITIRDKDGNVSCLFFDEYHLPEQDYILE